MSKGKSHPCRHGGRSRPQTRLVARSSGEGVALLLNEGIPVHSCSLRGETDVTASTVHEIEYIRVPRGTVPAARPVSVGTFS